MAVLKQEERSKNMGQKEEDDAAKLERVLTIDMWRICEKERITEENPEESQTYQWAVWFLTRVDNESITGVGFSTCCWWAAKEPKVCGKENAQGFVLKINQQIENGPSLYPPSEIWVWIFPSQPVPGEEFN